MYRNLRNGAALLLLAAGALATLYFGRRAPTGPLVVEQGGGSPLGYYLRDTVLLGTDDKGRILYRLHAGLAEEQPDEARLVLRDVHFEYQPAEQIPWSISASSGEAPTTGERAYLDLEGDVRLTRDAEHGGQPTEVETDRLRIEPARRLASTTSPVRVTVGGRALFEAVGLKALLGEDRLQLESKVHGQLVR